MLVLFVARLSGKLVRMKDLIFDDSVFAESVLISRDVSVLDGNL